MLSSHHANPTLNLSPKLGLLGRPRCNGIFLQLLSTDQAASSSGNVQGRSLWGWCFLWFPGGNFETCDIYWHTVFDEIFLRGHKQSYKQVFFFILLGVAEAAARAAASKKLVSWKNLSVFLFHLSLFLFLFLGFRVLLGRLCSCRPTKSGENMAKSESHHTNNHLLPHASLAYRLSLHIIESRDHGRATLYEYFSPEFQASLTTPLSPGITVGYIARLPHGAGLCQWHAPSLCGCAAMCLSFRSQSREPQQPGLPQRNLDAESMRVWEFIGWTWNC